MPDVAAGVRDGDGPGDNRREEIIRAALDVIAERGFAHTRIADVARRAGTSPALVIYYFGTKDSLLTEAVRLAEDLWYTYGFSRMEAVSGAAARLEEMVTTGFVPAADVGIPDLGELWVELWTRSLRHPEVARVRAEFDSRWRRIIADVVRAGQGTGEFGPSDPEDFAVALSALLDGLAVQVVLDDPSVDPGRALRIAMEFASATLGFPWEASGPAVAPAAAGIPVA